MPDLQNLLDKIEQLDQEATKGPWGVHFGGNPHDEWLSVEPRTGSRTICTVTDDHQQNAELIAMARTVLPQFAKALRAVTEYCQRMGDPLLAGQIMQTTINAMEADHD